MSEAHLFDPQTLYRHWEDAQWSPWEIELSADREQWQELDGDDRGLIFWVLSSLVVAEERITTKFSGLVGAHGSEEEATFLATQQVDEARHKQFYARFQDEIVAEPAAISAHVARAREQISPAFRTIFDVALVEAHEALVANPGDVAAKVPPDPRGNPRPHLVQLRQRLP
jgi:ribonucleoside-diphosphate reductase beta chain